jgi:hypothetical protein
VVKHVLRRQKTLWKEEGRGGRRRAREKEEREVRERGGEEEGKWEGEGEMNDVPVWVGNTREKTYFLYK